MKIALAVMAIAFAANVAAAQPASTFAGANPAHYSGVSSGPAEVVQWWSFTLTETVGPGSGRYLILDTWNNTFFHVSFGLSGNSELGLYNGAGLRLGNWDNTGDPGLRERVLFGDAALATADGFSGFTAQPTVLNPGTYYAAVGPWDVSFGASLWNASATILGTVTGSAGFRAFSNLSASAPLAFTYQGVLTGVPGGGSSADLRFSLWNLPTGGQQRGATLTRTSVPLTPRGLFSVNLDYGSVDPAAAPWLQIEVAQPGSGAYTTLSPRQRLGSAPVAAAAHSVPWSGITGVPGHLAAAETPWSAVTGGIAYLDGRVGIGTAAPTYTLCVDPQGPGGIIIGGPDRTAGGRTSLTLGVTARSGGAATIESISTAGGSYGSLLLNPVAGAVGINTSAPTANLSVNGSANKPGGGSWSVFSDARLKHDITPLERSLEKLLSLRGVSFVYDDPQSINELPGRRIGMVAQEVEGVFPDWVETGPSGYKSLTFRGFEALTVEALRELRAENEALRTRDESLKTENDQLRRELDALKAAVAELAQERRR